MFNGASLLVDRAADGDLDDIPRAAAPPNDIFSSGGPTTGTTLNGRSAGSHGGALSDGPESLVDPMAWRKYSSLVELYGFLGARPIAVKPAKFSRCVTHPLCQPAVDVPAPSSAGQLVRCLFLVWRARRAGCPLQAACMRASRPQEHPKCAAFRQSHVSSAQLTQPSLHWVSAGGIYVQEPDAGAASVNALAALAADNPRALPLGFAYGKHMILQQLGGARCSIAFCARVRGWRRIRL